MLYAVLWGIFILVMAVVLGTLAIAGISAAPWVPLWRKDIHRMMKIANVKPGDAVYDLGAGDGRMVVIAAQRYGADATGYEFAVLPYFLATTIIRLKGLRKKARIKYANFFKANLGEADVICTFLTPHAMKKLKPKFERELKPGARVVSYAFQIHGWEPTLVDKPNAKTTAIYFYQR